MNQREQRLLDKQLSHLYLPERHDGILAVAIFVMFLIGLILGTLLSEPSEPTRIAANDPAIFAPVGAPATAPQ